MKSNTHTNNVIDLDIPNNFDEMIDDSFKQLLNVNAIHHGDIINGTVVKITEDDVFLDLGLKTEGRISINEFQESRITPEVGNTFQVYVIKNNTDNLTISFTKSVQLNSMNALQDAYRNNQSIKATVKEIIPNGFSVEISNYVRGFVHISQMDSHRINEKECAFYVGKEFEFLILELFRNKKLQPILSRRKLLIESNEKLKDAFLAEHKEGDIIRGIAKTFTSFGVFIDLGGFDALLHISDISWRRSIRPTEVVKKNEEYDFKIIKIDPNEKKISLSLKALQENPWDNIEAQYKVGSVASGEVIKILPYGAFISIDQEIEGLIHVSEMSWIKHVQHPKEVLQLGSMVQCKILSIDKEKQRLSLGLKQAQKNPWDTVSSLYPVGFKITLPIKRIVQNGLLLEFEEGYRGFISREDYSWNKKNYTHQKQGESVECVVISHDKEHHQINLGIKQLEENPWNSNYFVQGKAVEGIISSITDFGIFVKFPNGIEGLIPKNKTFDPKEYSSYDEVRGKFKKGATIQTAVLSIQKSDQKLLLSLQSLKDMVNQQEMEKHIVDDSNSVQVSIGDIINNTPQ